MREGGGGGRGQMSLSESIVVLPSPINQNMPINQKKSDKKSDKSDKKSDKTKEVGHLTNVTLYVTLLL